jgi:hypothetical protein
LCGSFPGYGRHMCTPRQKIQGVAVECQNGCGRLNGGIRRVSFRR